MQRLSLQQKLQQKLSPLQIQVIKLLEVPSMELEQRIKKELEENPALDEGREETEMMDQEPEADPGDDFSLDEYQDTDDIPSYRLRAQNYSKNDKTNDIPFSVGTTFHEFLINQMGEVQVPEESRSLVEYVIGNIDEDGYIRREIEAMVDDLAFMQNILVSDEKMEEMLQLVQKFDPPGVAARDLRECLLLQIRRKDHQKEAVIRAEEVLENYFEEFTRKHFDKILKRSGWTDDEFRDALDEIQKLNPKPGSSYNNSLSKTVQQIVPDFILEEIDGNQILSMNNRNVPDLRVSHAYSEMLETYSSSKKQNNSAQKEAALFVKQKLDSARWFIEAIKQRNDTLMTTMQSIIDLQRDYFIDGDETLLKPMHLKDVAEKTGYDISTISRVSNSKYIQTHFGIFSLKSFFSDGMATESGEEVSTKEIKKILEEAIVAESKRKPLTDEKLTLLLKKKGYLIARRTVAKYREQLGIPVARLRKEM